MSSSKSVFEPVFGLFLCAAIGLSCGGSNKGGGASVSDAGKAGPELFVNTGVTQACQTCLSGATGNDCSAQAKTCANDSICTMLNACVNKCANLNASCIQNCSNAASTNADSEWGAWQDCACADCTAQCEQCSTSTGAGTCDADDTVDCAGQGNGYSCTGADTPDQDGLATTCSAPTSGTGGLTLYCCN